jgi:hypothetical protein
MKSVYNYLCELVPLNIYPITFYGLLSILIGLILYQFYLKVANTTKQPVKEGMSVGGEISRAFNKPINEIKNIGNKTFNSIGNVFKIIGKLGKFIGDVFEALASYLECGVFYVGNLFTYCLLYYLLYVIGLMVYAPFALLFWATGTQDVESAIWDILSTINEFAADISGFNILDYIYPDKCYKCQIKKLPKLKL